MPGERNVLLVLLSMMTLSVNFVVVVWEDVSSFPIPVKPIVAAHFYPADY
jgi:hypothetical protein